MERFEPQRWLRISGVVTSLVIAARKLIDQLSAGPEALVAGWKLPQTGAPAAALFRGVLAIEGLALAGFLAAFLYCTRSVEPRPPRPFPVLILLAQIPLSLVFGAELLIVATIAVPFVLVGRAGWMWLAVEIALMWMLTVPGAQPGNIEMSPGLAHTPFGVALFTTLVEATAWVVFAYCAGYLIVRAERNRRELAFRNAELEATQGLLAETSALNERLRISRELHDTVGHHLVGLSVNLELASHLATDRARVPVERAQLVARLLLADVRETVSLLRESRPLDLRGALARLAAGISDLNLHLDLSPALDGADASVAHLLFRCAQEAVTNTRKHAGARNFWLAIQPERGGFRLTAKDDGRGAGHATAGNGLRGMRERAEETGGTVSFSTGRGQGFQLEVWAPDRRLETEPAV